MRRGCAREGRGQKGDGGRGQLGTRADPTLTVVLTEHLMRAMEKESKLLVSSIVISALSATAPTPHRWQQPDGRTGGRTDLANLICIGERAKQLAPAERLPFCSLASPASGFGGRILCRCTTLLAHVHVPTGNSFP